MFISKNQYKNMFLPKIGEKIVGKDGTHGTIIYIHDTKLRLTAEGKAKYGDTIEINNMIWQIDIIDDKHNRWNASIIGIKQKEQKIIEPAPETNDEETTKVLD